MSEKLFKKLVSFTIENNECDVALQEFVENLDVTDMISLVTNRITKSEGSQALKYLLLGCTQKNSSQKKRIKLVEAVLKEVQRRKELSGRTVFNVVFQIAVEVDKFSTVHLVKLCELCVEFIRSSTDASQSSWKELLPKVLSSLETRKTIDYEGTEMSGAEFKNRIILTICMSSWDLSILTTLTAMFSELHLNGEQLGEVVNKLCRSFEELPWQEIPPFVHQLLELCHEQYANLVFLTLRKYFGNHVYKLDVDEEPDSMDIMDSEGDDVKSCESMVLYHIEEAAKLGHGSINQLLRYIKSTNNSPEYVIDPFLLAILLSVSTISTYETQVMGLLKGVFIRNYTEEEKKLDSAWLRTMIPAHCDTQRIIMKLIDSKTCENVKVLTGFINLGLSFLSLSKKTGTLQNSECLWKLGQVILIKLVQKHTEVCNTILKKIVDCIFNGQNVSQYTDCLRKLCSVATLLVMKIENQTVLMRLVNFLNQFPGDVAEEVVVAILPVVRISSKLRDNLILALRKGLFSKEVQTRKMAVNGFIRLLKYLEVKKLMNLSQSNLSEYSGPSVFSQMCAEVHMSQAAQASVGCSSNEAICLEVVGVLRRCFVQKTDVKVCLYEGLFGVVDHNPELGPNILELLLSHFSEFYKSDETVLPPIDFPKAVTIQGVEAVIQEPLGHLLFAMQQIVVKVKSQTLEHNMEESFVLVDKLTDVLSSLTNRFARCDLNHFELDEETNLTDNLPECLQRKNILYQTIAVYEALMAYTVFSWTEDSNHQQGVTLVSLFKVYSLLYEYIKNYKVNKKKEGTQKKDKGDGKKLPTVVFKPPETILSLPAIIRLLHLLLSNDLEWATSESTTDLKTRRPLMRYALQAALEVVTRESKNPSTSSTNLKNYYELGRLLNIHCLSRYEQFKDHDLVCAVTSIECFTELFSLISTSYKSKIPHFLKEIDNVSIESGLSNQLKPIITKLENLLQDVAGDDDTEETFLKRESNAVINCLNIVCLQLPVNHGFAITVTNFLWEFAEKKMLKFSPTIKSYMSLMFTMLLRCKTEATYLDNMAVQFCDLIGTHDDNIDVGECKLNLSIINEQSVFNALPLLCNTINNMLESIKWLLARLRCEISASAIPASSVDSPTTRRDRRKRKERELVQYIGLCVNVAETITAIALPTGYTTEVVFQMLTRIFITLTDITKYFTAISSNQHVVYQEARFGKIVKLASYHLSAKIPDLILYVAEGTVVEKDKKKGNNLMSYVKKQAQYIPRLTGELENFTKCVSLLSTKCKDPQLAANLKLTTTRDFRLNIKKVEEIMSKDNQSMEEIEEENVENNPSNTNEESQPRKKSRKS